MIEIDGSYGEGGGQIIRTAVSLAVVTQQNIRITNIRSNRPKPGLAPQHITAISALQSICNCEVSGLTLRSSTIEFKPGKILPGKYKFDIGTAGSISLVIQTCILPAVFGDYKGEIELSLTGGTDVKWSPPFDYLTMVYLKNLEQLGANVDIKLLNRGFYPKGGGKVDIFLKPGISEDKIRLSKRGEFQQVLGRIFCYNFPNHIAHRINNTVRTKLSDSLGDVPFDIELDMGANSIDPGVGIVLSSKCEHTVLGSSALGEKGLPAEKVGQLAFEKLINDLNSNCALDIYAADQMIPYLGLLGGSLSVSKLSKHTKTNIKITEQLLNKEFSIIKTKNSINISI